MPMLILKQFVLSRSAGERRGKGCLPYKRQWETQLRRRVLSVAEAVYGSQTRLL